MILLSFNSDLSQKRINALLNGAPVDSRKVMKLALNATARKAWAALGKETQKQYAIQDAGLKKGKGKFADIKIKGASNRNMAATIFVSGRKVELFKFQTNPSTYNPSDRPDETRGKVLKSSTMKPVRRYGNKAFVVKFKSGHVTLAARTGDANKIKSIYSPSVPHMVGGKKVYWKLQPVIGDILQEEVQKRIKKELKKYEQ